MIITRLSEGLLKQKMSVPEYDVIVVGAGVEGSSTAYNLVKNGGGRVLLLEQVGQIYYVWSRPS